MPCITRIETFTSTEPEPRLSLCRVCTDDGHEGFGQLAWKNADIAAAVLHRQVAPHALGREPGELAAILQDVVDREAKFQGTYLCRAMAGLDTAVWDVLGKQQGMSVCELLGGTARPLAVYGSSMQRATTPEQEVRMLAEARERHGYAAFKIKIGKRRGHDADEWPGRTEQLVAEARRTLGDDVTLLADANSCYSPGRAIEVGRLLEDHGYAWFEEPCPHLELEQTAEVAAALDIDVAGGEQDWDLSQFRRMIAMDAVDVVQFDIGYVGGITRARQVATMAKAAGKRCCPHSANCTLLLPFTVHLFAALDNTTPYVEHNVRHRPDDVGLFSPPLEVRHGRIDLPPGPGWGVTVNPDWLAGARRQVSVAPRR